MTEAETGEVARRLAPLLSPDRPSNPKSLRERLGVDEASFEAAANELVARGGAEWRGRRLILAGAPAQPQEDRRLSRLSEPARRLFDALPADGSRLSNAKLRSRPALQDLGDDVYPRAKAELLQSGLVRAGAGRTGTLARVVPAEEAGADEGPGAVEAETELYEPFSSWIESTLAEGGFAFARAAVTAGPRGRARASGKWSRPDVTALTVSNFELLPGAAVEARSFEIKRSSDAARIESVYEAAAHGRWAHRASDLCLTPRLLTSALGVLHAELDARVIEGGQADAPPPPTGHSTVVPAALG